MKKERDYQEKTDQYKNMKVQAKALLECLITNPINSKTAKDAIKAMRDSLHEYEAHCKRHPKDNPTRAKRLESAFRMGRSLFYIVKACLFRELLRCCSGLLQSRS